MLSFTEAAQRIFNYGELCLILGQNTNKLVYRTLFCVIHRKSYSHSKTVRFFLAHPVVSSDPFADTQFPSAGAIYTRGWENWRFSTEIAVLSPKRCEIGQWLLWNVNRKSWVPDWMVSFSMILRDL